MTCLCTMVSMFHNCVFGPVPCIAAQVTTGLTADYTWCTVHSARMTEQCSTCTVGTICL